MMKTLEKRRTIHGSDWDVIDPNLLLPLVGVRDLGVGIGCLLRHYWVPDTELRYRTETIQQRSKGTTLEESRMFARTMTRCTANLCAWREKTSDEINPWILRFMPGSRTSSMYEYDRLKQTLRQCSPNGEAVADEEARRSAMLSLPILVPLLPVPVGFRWHVTSGDSRIDYTLESVVVAHRMNIAYVRRRGLFSLKILHRSDETYRYDFMLEREGVTAFALDRSVVLEDRVVDEMRSPGRKIDGTVTFTTTKLILSTSKY